MKLFTAAALLFGVTVTPSLSSSSMFALAEEAEAHIHVHCDHLLHKTLTKAEQDYTTQAIVLSYNDIHALTDGGDIYLSNPHWEDESEVPLGLRFDGFEQEESSEETSSMVEGSAASSPSADGTTLDYYRYWGADWWFFSSWRCGNLCYNGLDDCDWQFSTLVDEWICTRRKLLSEHEVVGRKRKHRGKGGVDEKDWGTFFESFLRSGPWPALQKVRNCKVEMRLVETPKTLADEEEEEDSNNSNAVMDVTSVGDIETPVNIQLECQGVNFSHLSDAEKAYAALTMVDTYNSVDFGNTLSQLDFDGDGDDIMMQHANLAGWMAGDCQVCEDFANSNNNRVYLRTHKIEPMEKVKQWTDSFVKAVTSGPFAALSGIHECAITVLSAAAAEEVVFGPARNA